MRVRYGARGGSAVAGIDGPRPGAVNGFPRELLDLFTPVEHVGYGGEADVFLVRPHGHRFKGEGGDQVALKVYLDAPVNADVLEHVGQKQFRRHVPTLYDFGNVHNDNGHTIGWEAQEYCPHRSLLDLTRDRQADGVGPLPEDEVRAIVSELARCLWFWQRVIDFNHTDLKPANVLIRSRTPWELVIGDVGGAVRNSSSQRFGPQLLTPRYAAPEQVAEMPRRDMPPAWWSLGTIVYELLTGQEPYAEVQTNEEITARLKHRIPPDLSAVTDPRWLMLVTGLVDVDRDRRWRYEDVQVWLEGGIPKLRRPTVTFTPLIFERVSYTEPARLLQAMHEQWATTEGWLARDGADALARWLSEEVRDPGVDLGPLRAVRGSEARARLALAALTVRYLPDARARYCGYEIDDLGLRVLASGDLAEQKLLRQVIESGVLGYAALHRCHVGCRGKCRRLTAVMVEVPEIMREFRRTLNGRLLAIKQESRDFGLDIEAGQIPAEHEVAAAWALATALTLDPSSVARLRRASKPNDRGFRWWRNECLEAQTADERSVVGRATLVRVHLLGRYARELRGQVLPEPDPARVVEERARRASRHIPVALGGLVMGGLACYGAWALGSADDGSRALRNLPGTVGWLRSHRLVGTGPNPLDTLWPVALTLLVALLVATVLSSHAFWSRGRLRLRARATRDVLTSVVVLWLVVTSAVPLVYGCDALIQGWFPGTGQR
jgi:serine/threonine protein kinase